MKLTSCLLTVGLLATATLTTVGGRAILETVNGDIEVQTVRHSVNAKLAQGDITAGFVRLTSGSSIQTSGEHHRDD